MKARRVLAKRSAPILLAAAALLLTPGGAILVARKVYADRLATKASSSAMPLIRAEPPSGLPTLLFVGDSRVAEWGLPRLAGFHVVNAGFPGCTTSQIAM